MGTYTVTASTADDVRKAFIEWLERAESAARAGAERATRKTDAKRYTIEAYCYNAAADFWRRVEVREAPDMLAALKLAREYIASVDGTMSFTAPEHRATAPDLAKVDAAIAKAEGRQS